MDLDLYRRLIAKVTALGRLSVELDSDQQAWNLQKEFYRARDKLGKLGEKDGERIGVAIRLRKAGRAPFVEYSIKTAHSKLEEALNKAEGEAAPVADWEAALSDYLGKKEGGGSKE